MLYSLDEICLFPAQNTKIRHRSDITVFTNKNKYPIFTAPMHCIVDENNIKKLDKERLNVIVPRTVAWKTRLEYIKEGYWVAVGFKEAEYIFTALLSGHITASASNKIRICIDQANGHMSSLLELCKKIKSNFGNCVKIMTGNIANPATYTDYAAAGIDYVRVGIGGGNACFPAGTKIKTAIGEKCIENIDAGDTVITLNGEKTVTNKFIKSTDELITINNEIQCTPDHKFLVINKSDKDIVNEDNLNDYSFYIEAKNLNDDYLLVQA